MIEKNKENEPEPKIPEYNFRTAWPALVATVFGIALGVLIAFLTYSIVSSNSSDNDASKILQKIQKDTGEVAPFNVDAVPFSGEKVTTENKDQKALAKGTKATTPPKFIFNNGKNVSDRKTLEIFGDFSTQRARDMLIMNESSFKELIETGKLELQIYSVPSEEPITNSFSVYSTEALAEMFHYSPEHAWDFMIRLMRLSSSINTTNLNEVAEKIANEARRMGIEGVEKKSIQGGEFASWIVSVNNDSRLSGGPVLPIVYIDGKQLPHDFNLNDQDAIRGEILK